MIGNRQNTARLKSDFYRDKYQSILRAFLFSVCLLVALICAVIYIVLTRATPLYYATSPEGQIIPMTVTQSTK